MEKPGMDRRYPRRRTGLLVLLAFIPLFFFSISEVFADPEGELSILVETSPERPVLGGSWRVSILVNHANPEEVTVTPPALPSSLTFAQVRTETRWARKSPSGDIRWFRNSFEEGTRWTLVEFLFVPQRTGTISLGAFEVLVPRKRALTRELRTTVATGDGKMEYHPRLIWETYPSSLGIGESALVSLRVIDWDPEKDMHPARLRTTAPEAALLEELPLDDADLARGRVLRFRLTPLEGSSIVLGPFSLRIGSLTLESPFITIPLTPASSLPPGRESAPSLEAVLEAPPPDFLSPASPAQESPRFPENPGKAPLLFRESYGKTLEQARALWTQGFYAQALGALRRGERDLLAGPGLIPLRRAAEQALGLTGTGDEKWRPRNFFKALIILSLCLFIPLAVQFFFLLRKKPAKKNVTSGSSWGYKSIILVLISILGVGIGGLIDAPADRNSGAFFFSSGEKSPGTGGNFAGSATVLQPCEAYRVPDIQGAISARWKQGQPVLVRTVAERWAYAETADGEAGWLFQDNLVFY
jgi:hypothetical protein